MSEALRKADGDIFINIESGRSEVVTGPDKVAQEMFSCYASEYDAERDWGSNLRIEKMVVSSYAEFRALLFNEVADANNRIIRKQSEDLYLDTERELIRGFNQIEVYIDPESSSGVFVSTARVGDENTEVGKSLMFNIKPLSIRHVMPPPIASGLTFFK